MGTYFVTGGCGFIGSAFLRKIFESESDAKVINYDLLTYAGNLENCAELETRSGYRFVQGDIRDRDAVLNALPESCNAVFNFAAESHVDRSIESAQDFVTTNVLGTQVLLDCAREKKAKLFVQVSTDEVMGPSKKDEVFTEEARFNPSSPYAASKAAAEHLVKAAQVTFGLEYQIFRPSNNYGPRQFPEKLIPLMITNSLKNQPLPVYGDGKQTRDWIYVDDCCEAIWRASKNGSRNSVFNVGARNPLSNLEVIETLLGLLGKPESLIEFVADRKGHDRRYSIDPSKLENEIDWQPTVSWEEGIQATVDWYSDAH